MIICYSVPEIWHMMDVVVIFHFRQFFALLPPPPPIPRKTSKNKKLKKKMKKNPLEISSFNTSVLKIMIIWFTVPKIWYMTHVITIFHFGLFFALLPT